MFIFVKEGIRKLSDLNTVRGNNTSFILIRWHLVARMSLFKLELEVNLVKAQKFGMRSRGRMSRKVFRESSD